MKKEDKIDKCWRIPKSYAKGFPIVFPPLEIMCLSSARAYGAISNVKIFIIFLQVMQSKKDKFLQLSNSRKSNLKKIFL